MACIAKLTTTLLISTPARPTEHPSHHISKGSFSNKILVVGMVNLGNFLILSHNCGGKHIYCRVTYLNYSERSVIVAAT